MHKSTRCAALLWHCAHSIAIGASELALHSVHKLAAYSMYQDTAATLQCIQEQWAKDSNSNDQDVAAAVQQLVPKRHEEVMGLMYRILLQEMHAE